MDRHKRSPASESVPEHSHLGAAGLGTWHIDIVTAAVTCNAQCAIHLAADEHAVVTPDMLLGKDDSGFTQVDGATADAEPFQIERIVSTPDGERWIWVQGVGHRDRDGRLHAASGFTLDITAQKERERALLARAEHERDARERSEALAATMDQFVMGVSHELRSPLNAIVTWAEVLHLATARADIDRAAEAIRRNGRQLSHMVDDLLDSGAITTGKLSMHRHPVDLRALVLAVAEDMQKQAEHKQIALRVGEVAACSIVGDESRMKQVVWNLLSNALKFTDAGSVEITLRVVDRQAEITVRDTGRGIGAQALPLVFERFRQIAPHSSGRVGGLGLGLWLVKHIVGLHGGTVSVRSDGPGCGSTFAVRIPCAAGGPTPDA